MASDGRSSGPTLDDLIAETCENLRVIFGHPVVVIVETGDATTFGHSGVIIDLPEVLRVVADMIEQEERGR